MNIAHASSLNNALQLSGWNITAAPAAGKELSQAQADAVAKYDTVVRTYHHPLGQGTQAQADAVAKQDTMVRKHHQPLGQRSSDAPSADELAQAVRGAGLQVDSYKPLSDEEMIASLKPEFIHPSELTETPASLGQTILEMRSHLR